MVAKRITGRRGRPTLFGPSVCRKIYKVLLGNNSRRAAYTLAGISAESFNLWMYEGEKHSKFCKLEQEECSLQHQKEIGFSLFRENVLKSEAIAEQKTVQRMTHIAKKDWIPNAWFLERRHKESDWQKEPTKIEHSVSGSIEHQHTTKLENLSPQQRMRMAAAMAQQAQFELQQPKRLIDVTPNQVDAEKI